MIKSKSGEKMNSVIGFVLNGILTFIEWGIIIVMIRELLSILIDLIGGVK